MYAQTNEKGQHFYIDEKGNPMIDFGKDTNVVSITQNGFMITGSEIEQKAISTINLDGQSYDIKVPSIDTEIKKIWERLNTQVSLVHNCANCGATLELEENKAIIHCKYCGSTYIVGPARLNSHY